MKMKIYNQNIWGNYGKSECVGNRNELICDLIYEYGADICGFQECNPKTSRAEGVDIAKLLEKDYEEVPTMAGKQNFTPIFYRRDKFGIVDSGWERYEGKNDLNSKSYTWCVFEDKASKTRFAYVSTHYWWAFQSEEDNLQRLENVDQIYALLQKIHQEYDVPVIMSGDLNSGEKAKQGTEPIEKMLGLGLVNLADAAETKMGHFTARIQYPVRGANDVYYGDSQPDHILDHAFMLPCDKVCVKSFVVENCVKALSTSDHCPLKIEVEIVE